MLYNKDWGKSKDPHSLSSLIDWLETKNPDEGYNYCHSTRCPLAKYYRSQGYRFLQMGTAYFYHGFFHVTPLPEYFNHIVAAGPHTYGAAVKRARGLLEQTQVVGVYEAMNRAYEAQCAWAVRTDPGSTREELNDFAE
jgi:hypothetical protein